jgi:soluble lytic murein transglycosylase
LAGSAPADATVEEALFNSSASPADIKAFFVGKEPTTAVGLAALASAHLADKDEARAKTLAAKAWSDYHLPAARSRPSCSASARCSPRPTTSAGSTGCCSTTAAGSASATSAPQYIRASLPLLSEDEKKKAEARLAVFLRAKNSSQLICQAAGRGAGRLGRRRAEGAGAAPAEERRGGLEDPARRAGRPCRQARRLVGGAARQRLRGAQAGKPKLAYDWCAIPAACPSTPARTRLPGGLAGAAPSATTKLALGHFQTLAEAADGP